MSDDTRITPAHLQLRSDVAYLDDSVIALRQVRRQLHERGLLLECYTSPDELLAREGEPKLVAVLLDVDLGDDIDGPEVARRLRARDAQLDVAFFTAIDAKRREESLRALGPVFDKSSALAEAVAWLEAHSQQRPAR
jgi:CheY-like chemotaxis protein